MITNQILISRELFDGLIVRQRTKDNYFDVMDMLNIANKIREEKNLRRVELYDYTKLNSTKEFLEALKESENGKEVWLKSKGGRGHKGVWIHPLALIDFTLWIMPDFKVKVYQWIRDKLVDNRCDSGDSFLLMRDELYKLYNDDIGFQKFIIITCNKIKKACKHSGDWNSASEQQLKLRDTIHNDIAKLCKIFDNPNKIVESALKMNSVNNYLEVK